MREKEKNMAKKNYYAVKQGKVPGIYRTWDACKAQVHGYPGAIYKGFERLEEAEAFLGGGKMLEPLLRETIGTYFAAPERKAVQSTAAPDPSSWDWEHLILAEKPCEDPEYAGVGRSAVAYVDGSYQHALGKFSCGVVLFLDGKELNLAEDYSDPDLVSMRNVAGEIKGAELAMAYCLTQEAGRIQSTTRHGKPCGKHLKCEFHIVKHFSDIFLVCFICRYQFIDLRQTGYQSFFQ